MADPVSPSSPAPTPAPAPSPGQTQITPPSGAAPPSDNAYAELDALDAEDKSPKPRGGKPPQKPESVRGADGKFQGQQGPDAQKAKEEAAGIKPPISGTQKDPAPPLRTAELRTRYDEAKAKIANLEPKVQQYERELAELRAKASDTKPFEERVSALQKENEALKEEIRYVNYQKHPEFVTKYQKPYQEAWGKAVAEISQLSITMDDGTTRRATANDFLALANAPLDQLDNLAEAWFPKSAARVVRHVEKVRDLAEAQEAALTDARKSAGEREKQQTEQRQQGAKKIADTYVQSTTELTQKYPKWFAPEEGDEAGNELLKKGFEYADSVFHGNGSLAPEQKVKRLAVVRAKAANHDRLASKLKAASARIKELEADLAEYEKSGGGTAGAGSPGGGDRKDFFTDAMREIESLDKK